MSYVQKRRTVELKTANAGIRESVAGQCVLVRKITFWLPWIDAYQVGQHVVEAVCCSLL